MSHITLTKSELAFMEFTMKEMIAANFVHEDMKTVSSSLLSRLPIVSPLNDTERDVLFLCVHNTAYMRELSAAGMTSRVEDAWNAYRSLVLHDSRGWQPAKERELS